MKVERWEAWSLAAIFIVAIGVRILGLDAGLWYDEVFTLTHYVRAPLDQLIVDFSSLNNHMLYSLQAKASVALFGESAWVLRLPAMLFGLGSLLVIWALGRAAAGRRAALFAVLLTAISYHHVWFSQNARGYTGILFWTSFATLLLINGLKRPSWRIWTAYGVCVAAGMYTHLSTGFFFLGQAIVYGLAWLVRRYPGLAPYPGLSGIMPIFGLGLGGLLTLILHLPLFQQVLAAVNRVSDGKATSAMAVWVNPLRTLQEITGSLSALGTFAPVALYGALLVIAIGGGILWRRSPLLVAIYTLSIPLTLALLLLLDFRIWPRYFFVDIGFVFLCLAAGAEACCIWVARRLRMPQLEKPLFATGVLVASLASLVLLARNYAHPKQDFAGAMSRIAAERMPGDSATSLGLASEPVRSYFAPAWPVVRNEADVAALELQSNRVWLVTAFDDHVLTGQEDVLDRIQRDFVLIDEFDGTLGGGTVKVYRSK